MSLSKRILFGDDPADDQARHEIQDGIVRAIDAHKFWVATRRMTTFGKSRHWDTLWPSCVHNAVDQLGIKVIGVNSRVFAKTQEEADAIKARAELLYKKRSAERLVALTAAK